MVLLQVENLTKSVGDRMLFADVTFGMDQGDKVGLVAKNGSGKSTMMRILAGEESPDSGKITLRSGVRLGMLAQDSVFDGELTVIEACIRQLGSDDPEKVMELERLLTQLGIADLQARCSTLSGGQLKRMALAVLIASAPDIMLLDEPTNHLDIRAIEWLEAYLRRSRSTILMVTHDRYFLDRVCNKIFEIDRTRLYSYDGNYDYYLRRRAERLEAMSAELDKVRNTLRREQQWMSRQPQARAGKAKYRIDQFYELKDRSRVNLTERQVNLDAAGRARRIGSKIFEAEGICKRFGDKVILDGFTYTFAPGEKIGIVGENGVGKSTFVKMLQGHVAQDAGSWNVGETVRFGYYSQEGIALDDNKKVIDAVNEIAEDIRLSTTGAEDGPTVSIAPMQFLQNFMFSVPDQQKYIRTLSGGERRRLHLATVLMRQPNFLILDEPTNDLDIVTLGLLEEYLAGYKGCVIVVSHDRFFLDSIVDHLFVFEGDGVVRDFPGNYSDYREFLSQQQAALPKPEAKEKQQKPTRTVDRPRRLSFKEQRELQQLEADLQKYYAEKAELDALFNSGEVIADVAERSARYTELTDLIDTAELRWLELSSC